MRCGTQNGIRFHHELEIQHMAGVFVYHAVWFETNRFKWRNKLFFFCWFIHLFLDIWSFGKWISDIEKSIECCVGTSSFQRENLKSVHNFHLETVGSQFKVNKTFPFWVIEQFVLLSSIQVRRNHKYWYRLPYANSWIPLEMCVCFICPFNSKYVMYIFEPFNICFDSNRVNNSDMWLHNKNEIINIGLIRTFTDSRIDR